MLDEYFEQKKAVSLRFKLFREILFQSVNELSGETGISEEQIKLVETGAIIPNIMFIEIFVREYGLNLTWLVSGNGNIFFEVREKTPFDIYEYCKCYDTQTPEFQRFLELRTQLFEDENYKEYREEWQE
jgi:hypothetical protein